MKIFIFVRKGCCLCETLKNKLTEINSKEIKPKLEINEIDIDRFDLYQDKYKKFDHEVPVVAIKESTSQKFIELPKVSPRLKDDQLKKWLEKNINIAMNKNWLKDEIYKIT